MTRCIDIKDVEKQVKLDKNTKESTKKIFMQICKDLMSFGITYDEILTLIVRAKIEIVNEEYKRIESKISDNL